MIPGFEEELVGKDLNTPFSFSIKFPPEYNYPDLAGKDAQFDITIKKVLEGNDTGIK